MSLVTDATNAIGSIFGADTIGDDVGDWITTNIGSLWASPDTGGKGNGVFAGTGFYKGLLDAGLGLAGTYATQKENRKLAEEYAKQRKAEIENENKLRMAAIGAASGSARRQTLAGLYSNYGAAQQKMGESLGALNNQAVANIVGAYRG